MSHHKSTTSNPVKCKLFKTICATLQNLGFSNNKKGFTYICHAIFFGVIDKDCRYHICSKILPGISLLFETRTANVEKTSRHALEEAYLGGGFKNINQILGMEYLQPYEKPTLKNFISTLIEKNVFVYDELKHKCGTSFLLKLESTFVRAIEPLSCLKLCESKIDAFV